MSLLDPEARRRMAQLIIEAGLEEDFINWLKAQGISHVVGKFDNVPAELLQAYIAEKRLVHEGEEEPAEGPDEDDRYIPSKKGFVRVGRE